MKPVRVRFAPSPTGPLHIGGLRTALYNYLLARQTGGTFVLRIEDTDQKRYVPGAEEYIREALEWCGISPDEGPRRGGNYGPYHQSERREIYQRYVQQLLDRGAAYYAFDTEEELEARRKAAEAQNRSFRYGAATRSEMRNSLSLGAAETEALLAAGTPHVVRLLVEPGKTVTFPDVVRESVSFSTDVIDDQVLMKTDGLPTYHLANIVDDHLMEITHVIRGEEWLSSTPKHILLYRALGWEPPVFCHLPLLLNPNGKGKLSKRNADKSGFPIFPLDWQVPGTNGTYIGFREQGYLPAALVNFLAFLGWNPGTEQELFSLSELVAAFSLERINNSGARFDIEKAKWFNQQYLIATPDEQLSPYVQREFAAAGHEVDDALATSIASLLKERIHLLPEFYTAGRYFVEPVTDYEEKTIRKKWKPDSRPAFDTLADRLATHDDWTAPSIKQAVKAFMDDHGLGFGQVLPIVRVATSGSVQGPDAFAILETLGREESVARLRRGYDAFDAVKAG